jgi:hypothetical protein
MISFLLLALILSTYLPDCRGFSSWMTSDYCKRQLKLGEVIMNEEVVESNERTVDVYRKNLKLISNSDSFTAGEQLTVKISNSQHQYVYEISGNTEARIIDGGCNGKRKADRPEIQIIMPINNLNDPVTIVAAWAESHSVVKLSAPFILLPPKSQILEKRIEHQFNLSTLIKSNDLKADGGNALLRGHIRSKNRHLDISCLMVP